jgi:hypothetical protein
LWRRWRPPFRLPTIRRVLHECARRKSYNQVSDSEICESLKHSHALNQPRRNWRRHERSRSESAYCDSRDESAAIREPFHEHGYRNDVTKTQADAADYSIAQVEPPELIIRKTCQEYAQAVKKTAGQSYDPRTFAIQPQTTKAAMPSTKMQIVNVSVT